MAKRIKLVSTPDLVFKRDEEDVTYNLNITSNEIKFKISLRDDFTPELEESDRNIVHLNCTLSLATIKSMYRFHTNMLIGIGFSSNEFLLHQLEETRDVDLPNMIDISAFSQTTRAKSPLSKHLSPVSCRLFIYVRDINGTFDDWDILVHVPNKDHTFISNETNWDDPIDHKLINQAQLLTDDITSEEDTSYNNTDYYKFKVFAPEYNTELTAEPCVGIIDKTRIYMTNGQGSIRVLKSSVETGNKIIVKVGVGNYVRMHNIEKQL